jgi:hypothetical protein
VAAEDTLSELLKRLGASLADFTMFLNRLRESEIWRGVFLEVTIPEGDTFLEVAHGLGRAHRGAIVLATDLAWPVFALAPTNTTTVTLYMMSGQSADNNLRVWVF